MFNVDDGNNANLLNVSISGLTLTGGDVFGIGGAIRCLENLSVAQSTIRDNAAGVAGGGIDVEGNSNLNNIATITGRHH